MSRSSIARLLVSAMSLSSVIGCNKTPTVTAQSPSAPTFHRDVAPILFARCAGCHHSGGPAPFRLLTYGDARSRAGQIADVTTSRFMPPWLPEEGHEPLAGNRRLSNAEIKTLADWAAAAGHEGDPDESPAPPIFTSGWQLGEPDLVLESPAFELPADGTDQFRNFVLPVPSGIDRWVRAVELLPMNPQVTHHARLGIDVHDESARRDAADADVGYEGMAWGDDPGGQLITWTPGIMSDAGTAGAAWYLSSDQNLVLHTHLQPSGKPETVRFRLGFYFADGPPTLNPYMLRIGSRDIDIPAGASRYEIQSVYELPTAVDAHFVFPHAHSLCREIVVEAHPPTGLQKTLLAINQWDENWHDTYRFSKPVRLPHGTRLITKFTYNNSASNIRNPNAPPRRVVYGSNAIDEMSDVYLQVSLVDPTQYAVLAEHHEQAELKSKIIGYCKTLELHPGDQWSIEALASCYVADRRAEEAAGLLTSHPALLQGSVQANVILGMAQIASNTSNAAESVFRRAISMDDKYPAAWLGLGQAIAAKNDMKAAEAALRKAIELAPRLTVARLDLADLLSAQSRTDEAIAICEQAIEFAPTDYKPQLKLANLLAQQRRNDESLEYFTAARRMAPFVYQSEASLAIALYQFGDEQAADRLLREALAKDSRDPVPHCFLGQIARRNAQWPEARRHLQRASELPTPASWPASHRHQFLNLVFTEQLLLANEIQDEALVKHAIAKLVELDPTNEQLRSLLKEFGPEQPE